MPFVAWAAFCLAFLCMAPLCMGGLLRDGVCVVPISARPFLAWCDLPMRRICRVTRLGGVATAVIIESWLMGRTFARRSRGMPFIDFDTGHA